MSQLNVVCIVDFDLIKYSSTSYKKRHNDLDGSELVIVDLEDGDDVETVIRTELIEKFLINYKVLNHSEINSLRDYISDALISYFIYKPMHTGSYKIDYIKNKKIVNSGNTSCRDCITIITSDSHKNKSDEYMYAIEKFIKTDILASNVSITLNNYSNDIDDFIFTLNRDVVVILDNPSLSKAIELTGKYTNKARDYNDMKIFIYALINNEIFRLKMTDTLIIERVV